MMNILSATQGIDLNHISILIAGIVGSLGYGVVFLGILVLMVVIIVLSKLFFRKKEEKKVEQVTSTIVEEPVAANTAPGSAGQLKLYDTPPKTAAMIMAIVAEKTGKPLNELRFISIKEVK